MESQLFEYAVCEIGDYLRITCINCSLRVPIGGYQVGDRVDQIEVQYDEGKILLFQGEELQLVATHELHLIVGSTL